MYFQHLYDVREYNEVLSAYRWLMEEICPGGNCSADIIRIVIAACLQIGERERERVRDDNCITQ